MSLVRTRTRFSRLPSALAAAALVLACSSVVSAGDGDAKKDEADSSRAAKSAQQEQGKAEKQADEKPEGKPGEKAAPSLASIAAAAAERRREAAAQSEVITTEELQRRFSAGTMSGVYQAEGDATAGSGTGAAGTAPGAMPPPAAGDPLMALQQQRADAAARMRAVEQAEAEVNTLRARIQELERRALAVSNPYLPRPKVDQDDKSAEGWDEMDAGERRAQTQKAIADTKERLAQAEKRLAELRSGRGEF